MRQWLRSVLLFVLAAAASAQTCSVSVPLAPTIRSEGQTERVGDVVLRCTGGKSIASEVDVPTATFTLTFNANVTSRTLTAPYSEALLLVDEPVPGTQSLCPAANNVCVISGVGDGIGTYSGGQGRPNVFQGQASGLSQLVWSNVPFDPPGTGGSRILRFTNLRVAALGRHW